MAKKKKSEAKAEQHKNIEKDLKHIYQVGHEEKGKGPNMTKLDQNKQSRLTSFLYIFIPVLIVLSAAAWAGFFFFQRTPTFTGNAVAFEINAPFTAMSGESTRYTISIHNQEDTALLDNLLTVRLPNGFRLESTSIPALSPENEEDELFAHIKTWEVDSIREGGKFSLDIFGILYGEPESTQVISATLDYNPSDFSSTFQENAAFTTEISDSFISLETSASKQVADGEEMEYVAVITNAGEEQDFLNLQVAVEYPERFTPTSWYATTIDLDDEEQELATSEEINGNFIAFSEEDDPQSEWDYERLQPHHAIHFILKGIYNVSGTGEMEFPLTVSVQGNDESYITQRTEVLTTEIIKGELFPQLIIQGSDGDKAVNFGDTLNYLISVQNKSKSTLGDVEVRMVLNSPLLDMNTLVDDNGGDVDDNQITWTKEEIEELTVLFPSSEITIPFTVKLKRFEDITRKINLDDFKVQSFFETTVALIDNIETEKKFDSPIITNPINSNLTLDVEARYFDTDDAAIGSGPLPPVVGQKTTYVVFWKLSNSLHELSDLRITAKLPEGVSFEERRNLSTGSLFSVGDEVVWEVNRLPDSVPVISGQFAVSVTPESDDVKKILSILGETYAEATDTSTNGKIIQATSGLTTNLSNDPLAENKGLVQEN